MNIDVDRARAQTPGCSERIHFNNCGAALMPTPVIDAFKAHIDLEASIGGYEAAQAADDRIESTYAAIARLLNCERDEVALVENATRGWDMAFYALDFEPGDRILTGVAEYASNYIPYLQVARKRGAVIEVVPDDTSGALDVDALRNMMDERVKLISVTHVPTNGGLVNPAAEIGAVAREHGVPYLLDACQSAGQMPLDVQAIGADMLSATSRKFLRGPRGCGFLYVRREWIERLEPPFLDLHAATWESAGRYRIRADARRFENWESDVAARIAFGVAVDYALAWGLEAIEARVVALAERLRRRIEEIPGARVLDKGARRCAIVSFGIDGHAPDALVEGLGERGINLGVSRAASTLLDMNGRHTGELVRAGVHYYNTEDEVDACAAALAELAAAR
ncbi:MAG: aminotransferase class V-fold PLP-dependent enzyme [Gammaproteobacteria bacterium]|nr:aminotransferase class V-fold PLP-dependent enzyme [Gammaproteobacteria bacterium]